MSRKTSGRRGCGGGGSCSGDGPTPQTFAEVVRFYLQYHSPRSQAELGYFADSSQTFDQAIRRAGRSVLPNGLIHSHQTRIGHVKCAAISQELPTHSTALADCEDFASLHERVRIALLPFFQDGRLTVYDIAQRIGLYMGIEPELVYLHRGVRAGARALNPSLPARQKTLAVADLPVEFHALSPAQCEDALCLYKKDLQRIVAGHFPVS